MGTLVDMLQLTSRGTAVQYALRFYFQGIWTQAQSFTTSLHIQEISVTHSNHNMNRLDWLTLIGLSQSKMLLVLSEMGIMLIFYIIFIIYYLCKGFFCITNQKYGNIKGLKYFKWMKFNVWFGLKLFLWKLCHSLWWYSYFWLDCAS